MLTGSSALTRLATTLIGSPQTAVRDLLQMACELLEMDVAFVTRLNAAGGTRTVQHAVDRNGADILDAIGLTEPLELSWCGPVVAHGSDLVLDVADHPERNSLPATGRFGIVSHIGVTLRDPAPEHEQLNAQVIGTLCVRGRTANTSLNAGDLARLHSLASALAPLLAELEAGAKTPDEPSPPAAGLPPLEELAGLVLDARQVEDLTRPLLHILQELTQLASTYLAVRHEHEQEIRYTHNTQPDLTFP